MIDFDKAVEKIKQFYGFSHQKQVAEMFGLSQEDFSRRKKAGTILKLITEWAMDNNINLDWFLADGEEPSASAEGQDVPADYDLPKAGDVRAVAAARDVLKYGKPFLRDAISSCLYAFQQALHAERQIALLDERLKLAEQRIEEKENQINELRANVAALADLGLLRDLIDKEGPPEGIEERRRFMRAAKKVLHADPAYQKGSGS